MKIYESNYDLRDTMKSKGFTDNGVDSYMKSKRSGLGQYYDEYMGSYYIPEKEFNKVSSSVMNLLSVNGNRGGKNVMVLFYDPYDYYEMGCGCWVLKEMDTSDI